MALLDMEKLHELDRESFVYLASMMALQGSFANSSARATPASLVREADALWKELQEWKTIKDE